MAIQIAHICKHYGQQEVLHDLSLTIKDGEVVGLLGPNGAGKTTLMRVLLGLCAPDSVPDMVLNVPARMGYLPERNPLYEEMYVREYLAFIKRLDRSAVRSQTALLSEVRSQRSEVGGIEDVMERVGLGVEANKRIGELSKGYRQRVGLAQALIGNPEVLLLDEPTTGFDPNQLAEIRPVIRELGKQHTVILSTHILQEVREMCDRVIILDRGVIRLDQPLSEIDNLEETFKGVTYGTRF